MPKESSESIKRRYESLSDELLAELKSIKAENKRLREALKFYAEAYIDHEEVHEAMEASLNGRSRILRPRTYGHVARKALGETEGE